MPRPKRAVTFRPREDRDECLAAVCRWPGLRKEHKTTWHELCGLCQPGRRLLVTSYPELCIALGVAQSSIHRRLSGLARAGLVKWRAIDGKVQVKFFDPRAAEPGAAPRPPRVHGGARGGPSLFDKQDPPNLRLVTAHPEPVPEKPEYIPDAQAEPVPDKPESIPDVSPKTPAAGGLSRAQARDQEAFLLEEENSSLTTTTNEGTNVGEARSLALSLAREAIEPERGLWPGGLASRLPAYARDTIGRLAWLGVTRYSASWFRESLAIARRRKPRDVDFFKGVAANKSGDRIAFFAAFDALPGCEALFGPPRNRSP